MGDKAQSRVQLDKIALPKGCTAADLSKKQLKI